MKTAAQRQTLWTMVPSKTGRTQAARQHKARQLATPHPTATSKHPSPPVLHRKHETSRHYFIPSARTPCPSTSAQNTSRQSCNIEHAQESLTHTAHELPTARISRSVEARAPLWKIYDTWTRFEAFPHFMQGMNDTHGLLNESRMVWRIRTGDSHVPLESEVSEQIPYRKIAWKSLPGHPHANSGEVIFEAINEQTTHITAHFDFDLSGNHDWPGDPLPAVTQCLDWSLQCFCSVVESHVDPECELFGCPNKAAVA